MENRVRQLRKARNLSQRELAELVGTSQQQIQRIEAGRIAAKLELAARISAALEKPLNSVFPGAARVLKDAEQEMATTKSLPDTAWQAMRNIGIEGDPRVWTWKVLLRGQTEPMHFSISAAAHSYLYSAIQREGGDDGSMSFVVFDTKDRRIALNLSQLAFCHFLFDYGEPEEEVEQESCNVEIFFNGIEAPLSVQVDVDDGDPDNEDDEGQCRYILYMLETFTAPSDRYRLRDVDGEDAFVRAGDIALLSVPLGIVEPRHAEDEQGDEAVEDETDD